MRRTLRGKEVVTEEIYISLDLLVAILLLLRFLVGRPIFEMNSQGQNSGSRFPNAPAVLYQEFISPMIRFFYPQKSRGVRA